jgi:hypothetical protein
LLASDSGFSPSVHTLNRLQATPYTRTRFAFLLFALCAILSAPLVAAATSPETSDWQAVSWNGEKSLVSTHRGWKAIVSLERERLMHFGPADSDTNLLFAPARRADPPGWGGHRVWLGPQATWPEFWPPPSAWEHSGVESFSLADGVLRLTLPDAGDGWPRMTRTYRWQDDQLICGVEFRGGTRTAQVVQIFQVPKTAFVDVNAQIEPATPHGYVELPPGPVTRLTTEFSPPPQVTSRGTSLTLHHIAIVQKLGFRPQPLTAHESHYSLTVSRREPRGTATTNPDAGFFTQVYLGGTDSFIELEQLSPAFAPDQPVIFEVGLEGHTNR